MAELEKLESIMIRKILGDPDLLLKLLEIYWSQDGTVPFSRIVESLDTCMKVLYTRLHELDKIQREEAEKDE